MDRKQRKAEREREKAANEARLSKVIDVLNRVYPGQWENIVFIDANAFSFLASSEYANVNYETLAVISEAFGTKDIGIKGESIDHPGCESCAWSEQAVLITVSNITKGLS